MNIKEVLKKHFPGPECSWSLVEGGSYTDIIWHTPPQPIPTEADLSDLYEKDITNAPILAQIIVFEAQQTPRLIREAMTSSKAKNPNWKNGDGTERTATEQMAWIEGEISRLRLQLI